MPTNDFLNVPTSYAKVGDGDASCSRHALQNPLLKGAERHARSDHGSRTSQGPTWEAISGIRRRPAEKRELSFRILSDRNFIKGPAFLGRETKKPLRMGRQFRDPLRSGNRDTKLNEALMRGRTFAKSCISSTSPTYGTVFKISLLD